MSDDSDDMPPGVWILLFFVGLLLILVVILRIRRCYRRLDYLTDIAADVWAPLIRNERRGSAGRNQPRPSRGTPEPRRVYVLVTEPVQPTPRRPRGCYERCPPEVYRGAQSRVPAGHTATAPGPPSYRTDTAQASPPPSYGAVATPPPDYAIHAEETSGADHSRKL